MIIKACERGGAAKLAAHLLNEKDNEHIEVHEIRGAMSSNLTGAMSEAHAIAKGTQCKKFLFSVILSPPVNETPSIADYEDAVQRIEDTMKLSGQPRHIVFHEKEGRRHAHVIWSRINAREMKAINLPYFKNKLNDIARDLYLEHGWELPKGFIDREMRNPLNFTREEWQQAKRLNENPKMIKAVLKDCWAKSKTKTAFEHSLETCGFYLARGDRRGYVAVDWRGEIFSLSRWLNEKKKSLAEKLGEPSQLQSVDEAKAAIDQKLTAQVQQLTQSIHTRYQQWLAPMLSQKKRMRDQHSQDRQDLRARHEKQKLEMAQQQQARYKKGLFGLWDRITGKHGKIRKHNEAEAKAAMQQNREEREALITKQLKQRQHLQRVIVNYRTRQDQELQAMQATVFSKLPEKNITQYQNEFERIAKTPSCDFGLEM